MTEQPLYSVWAPGFRQQYTCLHDAIKAVWQRRAGAISQRLWAYEGYAEYPRLMAEVQCTCTACTKTTPMRKDTP